MSKQTSNSQQQTEQTHAQEELHKANQAPFSWMEEMMTPLQLWQQQFQQGMQQASQAFYDQFAQTAKNPQQYPPFQIWQQQFQQGLEQAQKAFQENMANAGVSAENMPFFNPAMQANMPQNPFDYWTNNPLTKSMTDLGVRINTEMMRMSSKGNQTGTSVTFDILENWRKFGTMMQERPGSVVDEQANLWKNQLQLWQNTMLKMSGQNPKPVTTPDKGDKRFKDEEWDQNPCTTT